MKSTSLVFIICAMLTGGQAMAQSNAKGSLLKNQSMKQFSLLVRVPNTYSLEQVKTANPQWEKLIADWKSAGVYVLSFAFPGESYTVSGPEKLVKKEAVWADSLKVVSNIVLQATDHEQAIAFAKQCPVLPFEGTVEIREIPKQLQIKLTE